MHPVAQIVIAAIVVYLIMYIDNKEKLEKNMNRLGIFLKKLIGVVTVEHCLKWHGLEIKEQQNFPFWTPKEKIDAYCDVFVARIILERDLSESSVTWSWKYV